MKILRVVLPAAVLIYAGICAILYFIQDHLLFFPCRVTAAELDARAHKGRFVPWENSRGEIIGWKSTEGDPAKTLLVCHGNGGFALESRYKDLNSDKACKLYLLEYPGYGTRSGTPSTQGFVDAATDALDSLHMELPTRKIWLVGESMGTGTVCAAAAARPNLIAGIVLVVPFDNLGSAAAAHVRWLPVRLLLRHHLDSDQNLKKYHGPVAFVVAGNDGITPSRLGQRLYDSYAGPKRLWLFPKLGHGDRDDFFAHWPEYARWLFAQPAPH
ncbi:MAG: alpha/beta hydrolase [Chthoniobacterales bacterium]